MPIQFLLDENLRGLLLDAIEGHNAIPGSLPLDVEQVGNPPGLPLGSLDPEILRWAEREGRIIVSLDRNTLTADYYGHLRAGNHSPGLFLLKRLYTIPDLIDSLVLAAHAAGPDEWRDRVLYIPF